MSNGNDLATRNEDDDVQLVQNEPAALAILNRSEIEAQVSTAHKYPRSLKRFLSDAITMATLDEDTAASCFYTLPRGGKPITGPSVRLAEMCASAWTNLHFGGRMIEVGDTDVTAQGVCHDLERNVRVTVEAKRRITGSNGKRYNDDMINVTSMAAISIALRNAIFRIIPRAFVNKIEQQARKVAVGDASTLAGRRAEVIARLGKMGADQARILQAVGKAAVEDIGMTELETLIGFGTSIRENRASVDECFPPVTSPADPAKEGTRMGLGARGKAKDDAKADAEAAAVKAKLEAELATATAKAKADAKPGELPLGEKREPGSEG